MGNTTWRKELYEAMYENDDTLIHATLSDAELDESFDPGFGMIEGKPFTAWGKKYVYFPIMYDGAEGVGSAPRFPSDEALEHQGGG